MLKFIFCFMILSVLYVTVVESAECGSGYHFFEATKFCYGRSFRYIGFWKDAEENCLKEGGHLASIHSEEEAEFISNIIPTGTEQLWIGLSNHGGEWQWNDGSEFDYSNWKNGTSIEEQKCAIFEDGKFQETECEKIGEFHFSICKRDPLII